MGTNIDDFINSVYFCREYSHLSAEFKETQIEKEIFFNVAQNINFFTGYFGAKIIHYNEIKNIWRKMEFYRSVYNCRSSSLALLLCCFYLACLHILSRTHHKKRKIRLECRQCKKWYTMVQSPYFYPWSYLLYKNSYLQKRTIWYSIHSNHFENVWNG